MEGKISSDANAAGRSCMFLLPASHGFLAHFNQAGLRLAIWESADSSHGIVGIFPGQSAGLLNAVALVDNLTGLKLSSEELTLRFSWKNVESTYPLDVTLSAEFPANQWA